MASFMHMPLTPSEGPRTGQSEWTPLPPLISEDETFVGVVRVLSRYLIDVIETPYTFEQLRTASVGHLLKPLITSLVHRCHHPSIVCALMVLKWQFLSYEPEDRGINEARGYACEIVAWRFLTQLSENEHVDYLLRELPAPMKIPEELSDARPTNFAEVEDVRYSIDDETNERAGLLSNLPTTSGKRPLLGQRNPQLEPYQTDDWAVLQNTNEDPTLSFVGLNALEIAAVAEAKKFLSQRIVQRVVNAIWCGDIVFWDSLSVHTKKKAQVHNKRRGTDPYSRLRVPKYQKIFEALFFICFLALYYAVLAERNPQRITPIEVLLYIWIAAFAYEEFGEFRDAGTLFYAADFWSLWDLGIIGVGTAYLLTRIIGLVKDDNHVIEISFDILSLEALVLVPRGCSLLSIVPYFGTLIPCLKEMTKDFIKFLGIVIIFFVGFLTTFTFLAPDGFTMSEISWVLVNVFFGSSNLGFDIASKISPLLGPTLMLIFACMAQILLITSLISLLSNSLTKVMANAREEYLFQYSVFVLEASASRRLTYYLPPLNLIPLLCFRPLRLFIPSERLRAARIVLLKATHIPFVAAIWAYEAVGHCLNRDTDNGQFSGQGQRHPLTSHTHSSRRVAQSQFTAALRSRSEASLLGKKATGEARPTTARATESTVELRQAIEKLSTQVEELTWRLSKWQEH